MQISKEFPIWTINWVNKIFQTLNNIESVQSLWLDHIIYTDFSFVWNTLTLLDAPTTSIFLDYTDSNAGISINSSTTLGTIKTRIWENLRQNPTSTVFSNTVLDREIRIVAEDVWRGKIINPITGRVHRAGNMFFQNSQYSFRSGGAGVVTGEVNVGDGIIETDTTNLLPAWYVLIAGDIIKYTSKTETELTGVTGILKTYLIWDTLEQIYEIPTTYDIMTSIEVLRGTVFSELSTQYEILRNESVPLIKLNNIDSWSVIRLKFITKYVHPTTDDEDFPFPDMYGESVISDIVSGKIAKKKLLPQADILLQQGFQSLSWMYMFFSKEKKELNTKIIPQVRKWRYNR